jgi:hypothetical protein
MKQNFVQRQRNGTELLLFARRAQHDADECTQG